MATLRNKRKLTAITRETEEEHPRNGQSRNTSVPRINEEYITQVSEEVEGRVTKKLSLEFSRTESRIFCALSKLDEFLLSPQIRTHSGTVPGTFRNTNVENQGKNEDDSQSDPHPEAGIFRSQATQNCAQKLDVTATVYYCAAKQGHCTAYGKTELWQKYTDKTNQPKLLTGPNNNRSRTQTSSNEIAVATNANLKKTKCKIKQKVRKPEV